MRDERTPLHARGAQRRPGTDDRSSTCATRAAGLPRNGLGWRARPGLRRDVVCVVVHARGRVKRDLSHIFIWARILGAPSRRIYICEGLQPDRTSRYAARPPDRHRPRGRPPSGYRPQQRLRGGQQRATSHNPHRQPPSGALGSPAADGLVSGVEGLRQCSRRLRQRSVRANRVARHAPDGTTTGPATSAALALSPL